METNVGKISLDMVLNSREFDQKLDKKLKNIQQTTTSNFSKIEKSAGGLTPAFGKLGIAIAAAFSIKQIAGFGKACLDLGSDLAEVQNVVDVTFGDMSSKVDEFASTSITQLGLSETAYKKYIGTFGAMSKAFKFSTEEALGMSKALVELTGDISSFYNLNSEEAFTKLKSVFTGETETLKSLGVVMTQTALDEYALAKGIGKTTAQMSEQEKVALRFSFVQDRLSAASGDFIRTQKGWANQTRILSMQFEAFKSQIGQGLINALTPVIEVINRLMLKLTDLAKKFKELTATVFGDAGATGSGAVNEITQEALNAQENIEGMGDEALKTSKKLQKAVLGFDEINKLNSPLDDVTDTTDFLSEELELNKENTKELENQNKEQTKLEKALERLLKRAKELKDNFENGFKVGLDATNAQENLNKILENIGRIKKASENIFDENVQAAADNFANKCMEAFGKITGAAAGAGIALEKGLTEGTADFLENKGPQIHDKLIEIIDINSEAVEHWGNIGKNILEIISNTFSDESFAGIVEHTEGIFSSMFLNVLELTSKFHDDVATTIDNVLEHNKENIETEITDMNGFISDFLAGCETIADETGESMNDIYNNSIHPLFGKLEQRLNDFGDKWHAAWLEHVTPILDEVGERWKNFCDESLKPRFEEIEKSTEHLSQTIEKFWKSIIQPVLDWCSENIPKVIGFVVDNVVALVQTLVTTVTRLIDDIVTAIDGIIQFIQGAVEITVKVVGGIVEFIVGVVQTIVGLLTGDMEMALEGCNKSVEGFCNSIVNFVQGLYDIVAGIITTITGLISGVIDVIGGAGQAIENFFKKTEDKGDTKKGFFANWFNTAAENNKNVKNILDEGSKSDAYNVQDAINYGKGIGTNDFGGALRTDIPSLNAVGTTSAKESVVSSSVVRNAQAATATAENKPINLSTPIYVQLDGRTIYKENKNTSFNEANRQGSKQYR